MDFAVFQDPAAIAAAIVAAIIVGLAKGGLAGIGVLAVPVLALAIPPVQAAGIILPILLVSDAVSVWTWRGAWDMPTVRLMLPGAVLGIGFGWATAAWVSDDMVRLIVGVIALGFVLRYYLQTADQRARVRPHRTGPATFWASLTGYTSFVAHAGGAPWQVYTMPLQMDPRTYTATGVLMFTLINLIKVPPYVALGQFGGVNLAASAAIAPVAVAFTFVGGALIRRMRAEVFYPLTYGLLALTGAKLIWDGLAGLV